MRYVIEWTAPADKQLRKLDDHAARRIALAVSRLAADPRPAASTPLVGRPADTMRLRVGDYRVIYIIEDDEIRVVVVRVAHRRQVYRDL